MSEISGNTVTEPLPDLRQQIRKAYQSGMYYNAMKKHFGISYTNLLNILREEGQLNESGRKSLKVKNFRERMGKIIELYQQGRSMLSIAGELGIDNGSVRYALKKAGVYKQQRFIKNRLTQEEVKIRNQQIVQMYQQGMKIPVIANLFNRDRYWVREILKREGLCRAKYRRLKKDEYSVRTQQICELYKQGMSMNAIGKKVMLSQPMVCNILLKAGLHNKRENPTGYLTKEEIRNRNQKIYQLYRNGKTIEEIAAIFKRDKTQIYLILKKAGLTQASAILNKQKREAYHLHICDLYKQGLRITDIARQLNAAKSSVRAILKRAKLR